MGGTGDGTCKPVFTAPSTPGHRLMTGLYTETLVGADRRVIVFYDRIEKQVGLLEKSGDGDGAWRDPQFLGEGTGPRAGAALDGSGELHVASMDADDKRLLYFAPGAESPIEVTDGIRESKAEYVEAAIGHDVDLWLASDGTPRLIFQDASRHTLHSATRTSDGWSVSTVAPTGDGDADSGAHGFYADATSTSDGPLIAEMIIDQTSDPATARLKFQSLQ